VQLGSAARGLIVDTDAAPSPAEEEQLNQLIQELVPDASISIEREQTVETDPMSLILALAAAAIALGAAGIATGLAGADRLADLGTLASVGAAPGVRRRLALSQAGIISGLGALLGMIAGLGGAGAMILALNQVYANQWPAQSPVPFAMPWQTLAVIVAVPMVAMAGAGLLSRARLPIERRF
ncbi:MAG TPA: ABC transporter, partial [Micromonosporaceae bacterium]|nr:ABC transporter [Micromonosporaceae bacterium]